MRQLKKAPSSVAPRFLIAQAPRADEILLDCLHGAEAMAASTSAHLLCDAIRGAVSGRRHGSHGSPNSFPGRIQTLLEKTFGPIIRQFLKTHGEPLFLKPVGLTRTARLREAASRDSEPKSVDSQDRSNHHQPRHSRDSEPKSVDSQEALLKRIDSLGRELAEAKARITREADWLPLVKASAMHAGPVTTSIAAYTRDYNELDRIEPDRNESDCNESDRNESDCNESDCNELDCNESDRNVRDETRSRACADLDLAGRCILCVGGRAKLYPEYRRLVETSGGSLLIYRSGLKNDADILSTLFECADMVVCPADCVNHDAYFAVKRYCKRSGKACVLLDRSNLPTFRKGVETLAALVAPPVVAR